MASEWLRGVGANGDLVSVRGLQRLGRLAAGSAMASANFATRAAHLGLRSGAQAIESASGRVARLVPGAALAQRLAETVDRETTVAARAASDRLQGSFELMAESEDSATESPREPARRRAWSELAADTALAPLSSLVASSIAVGAESIREVAASRPAQVALDAGLRRLGVEADNGAFRFETAEQRQSFIAVTTDPGVAAMRSTYSLAEAVARLAFSDTRQMRQTIEKGLQEMRQLADSADMQDLLPTPMVSESLQHSARQIVDRAPRRFLAALADDAEGAAPRFGALLRAAMEDGENLRHFLIAYPRAMTLIGADVGKLLFAGSITFAEMEAFLAGRRLTGEALESR